MIKKIVSVLGFASLLVLGAPAICYSDSLPGLAAKATGSQVGCVRYDPLDNIATNVCGAIHVFIPFQSRATGNFRFFATAPQPDATQCDVVLKDFNDNPQFSSGFFFLNNRTQLASAPVFANTTISYDCFLQTNGRLQSVDDVQF